MSKHRAQTGSAAKGAAGQSPHQVRAQMPAAGVQAPAAACAGHLQCLPAPAGGGQQAGRGDLHPCAAQPACPQSSAHQLGWLGGPAAVKVHPCTYGSCVHLLPPPQAAALMTVAAVAAVATAQRSAAPAVLAQRCRQLAGGLCPAGSALPGWQPLPQQRWPAVPCRLQLAGLAAPLPAELAALLRGVLALQPPCWSRPPDASRWCWSGRQRPLAGPQAPEQAC